MKKQIEFTLAFQIDKRRIFGVSYEHTNPGALPHFSTSIDVFNKPKTDYIECGQGQEDVLGGKEGRSYLIAPVAYNFFKKWDNKHLCHLTNKELKELNEDIEVLKATYNYIDNDNFNSLKELSKQKIKGANLIPTCADYGLFLEQLARRTGKSKEELRDEWGTLTYGQWLIQYNKVVEER